MGKYSPEYITKMKRAPMTLSFVRQAIKDRAILEARVISCDADNTLTLELGKNILGRIKLSELEYHYDEHEAKEVSAVSKIYKHIKFIPLSIDKENGLYIVECSRKQSQKECFDNYIKNLTVGDVIDAQLIRVTKYGAFCDIGCGIAALLPTNNISVTHIVDPVQALRYVYSLRVVVKSIDENYRIQLTHKELLGTWLEESSKFSKDDVVYGTVLSVEDYGIFVRLSQNLSGLADISDIKVNTGDTVSVRVTFIKEESMKIKLSIISKIDDDEGEHMSFKYKDNISHIKEWHYSTPTAKKQIDSYFS